LLVNFFKLQRPEEMTVIMSTQFQSEKVGCILCSFQVLITAKLDVVYRGNAYYTAALFTTCANSLFIFCCSCNKIDLHALMQSVITDIRITCLSVRIYKLKYFQSWTNKETTLSNQVLHVKHDVSA